MKISKQSVLGINWHNLWAICAALAIGVVGSQAQIFLTEGSNGQAELLEGVADQFSNILIHGDGELLSGANFPIQIGNNGQTAPTIQALDLAGSADNPTFWTMILLTPKFWTSLEVRFLVRLEQDRLHLHQCQSQKMLYFGWEWEWLSGQFFEKKEPKRIKTLPES